VETRSICNKTVCTRRYLRITYIAPYVPKGIPAGTLKEGTLTIVASSTL